MAIEESKLHRCATGMVIADRGNEVVFSTDTMAPSPLSPDWTVTRDPRETRDLMEGPEWKGEYRNNEREIVESLST